VKLVAGLIAAVWTVILVTSLIAWAIVEGICQWVRWLNHREGKHAVQRAATRRQLESREGARDG
jgi:hypothetical protein